LTRSTGICVVGLLAYFSPPGVSKTRSFIYFSVELTHLLENVHLKKGDHDGRIREDNEYGDLEDLQKSSNVLREVGGIKGVIHDSEAKPAYHCFKCDEYADHEQLFNCMPVYTDRFNAKQPGRVTRVRGINFSTLPGNMRSPGGEDILPSGVDFRVCWFTLFFQHDAFSISRVNAELVLRCPELNARVKCDSFAGRNVSRLLASGGLPHIAGFVSKKTDS